MPGAARKEADVSADGDRERTVRLTAWVAGRVQGVGFRSWVRLKASGLGLVGSAANLEDGRVEVVAEGKESMCKKLLAELGSGETPGRVAHVTQRWSAPRGGLSGFVER
jgi:acylphosphatase